MGASSPILNIKNLEVGYLPNDKVFVPFSVDAHEGELIALVGRNGMGKSTLLRTLAKLQKPLSGRIEILGNDLNTILENQKSKFLSFVPAEPIRIPNLDVRSFVAIARFPYTGWSRGLSQSDWQMVDAAMQQVGVFGLASRDISQISDGERQRAMIAFALAQDTKVILLDEPTAFLDLPNKFEMVKLLSNLATTKGKTIIYSTHDLQGAINEADSIWMMLPKGMIAAAPEDIALSKGFDELLINTEVQFDLNQGLFRNRKDTFREIAVSGEGAQLIWTQKMLQRVGYQPSSSKSLPIMVECIADDMKPSWRVIENGQTLLTTQSLGELAKQLRARI
jgi:iron complex transport system ATP-binding protein